MQLFLYLMLFAVTWSYVFSNVSEWTQYLACTQWQFFTYVWQLNFTSNCF